MAVLQSTAVVAGVMPDYARAGGVLHRHGTYTNAAEKEEGTTIEMVPIPKGARIIDMTVLIASATSFGTFDVGDGGDVDRFFNGIDTATAADNNFTLYADGTSNGPNYEYTAEDTIDIAVMDSDLSAKTRIDLNVTYVMAGTIADEAA